VSLIDVAPTVLDLQQIDGGPPTTHIDGRSLVPLIHGEVHDHRSVVMLSECTWQAKRGVRTAEWKYIRCWDPGIYPRHEVELYHLPSDPGEQHDVSAHFPGTVAQLDGILSSWMRASLGPRPDPMDEVVEFGLPAVRRLAGVIREDAEAAGAELAPSAPD
jgi:arylsulfatase A-like enzyme